MTVEFEGPQLFAAGPFGDDGRGHLRLILVERVESWLRAFAAAEARDCPGQLVDRMVERCALAPILLDQSPAVAWSVASVIGEDGEPRVRIEKSVRYSGDDKLFALAPRAELPAAPRAVVSAATLRLAATAPWDTFDAVRDAIEAAEQRVRQFLCWQHLDVVDINRELPAIAAERLRAWGPAQPGRQASVH